MRRLQRLQLDRAADHSSLRRRFEQNQEDCAFTVLALLPTVADHILEALPVESITNELQQQKQARLGQNGAASASEISSVASEDGRSMASFQTESYAHASQATLSSSGELELPHPKKTKSQLWCELKISSVTRSLTLIYALALLNLFTRIQLNLLGRRNYVLSVVALVSQTPVGQTIQLENEEENGAQSTLGNDFETNRSFLAFSWWLLHWGWRDIMDRVKVAVEEVFGPVNPREELSFERLAQLILDVRRKIEGASEVDRRNQKWLSYLLPPVDQEEFVLRESGILKGSSDSMENSFHSTGPPQAPAPAAPPVAISPTLRRLLDETSDIIDSPRFTYILTRLLDALFSELTDTAIRTQAFRRPDPSLAPSLSTTGSEVPPDDRDHVHVKLANILAVITRQAHAIGNGMPNIYVQAMERVPELESLAVVIFSSDADLEEIMRAQQSAAQSSARHSMDSARSADANQGGLAGTTWGMLESVWQKVAG